uniref:Uncharacterized protein n=1 Tax=viral metagenome TaxID=1070528 RepID=A0A6C0BJI2_9ZZZZ
MSSTRGQFFSERNEAMLDRLLYNDFQRRIGGDLEEKQKERLVKTVRHYMNEVYENLGEQPVQKLNTEVLAAVVPDYIGYLRRQQKDEKPVDLLHGDVASRFTQVQNERQEGREAPPSAPDFRLSLEDSTTAPSMSMFEQIKKQREAETLFDRSMPASLGSMPASGGLNDYVASTDLVRRENTEANRRDELLLQQRAASRAIVPKVQMVVPPDPRRVLFGDSLGLAPSGLLTQLTNDAQANPTTLPDAMRTRSVLPQDVIQKQEDILSYRENEYNLHVYSADRDWVSNSTENRYNFSINFDPANNRPGFGFSTAANIKFKNIVRIEFVKAILPTEGIDVLVAQTTDLSYNTNINVNILSFPYLMVRMKELDTNNYGTNNNIDNAFSLIQYDANWVSDNTANNRGYLAMIPKFMKCQKVYHPTPLATLQKLSFQIARPDGSLVSDDLDTVDISGFLLSSQLKTNPAATTTLGTKYADTSGAYIWIQTKKWFNKYSISQGDRLVFKNIVFPTASVNGGSPDFLSYIQRAAGHVVVDVGRFQKVSTATSFATGGNIQGYCNYIILRNNFQDPTTGSVSLQNFGGNATNNTALVNSLPGAAMVSGRAINMNHQTHFVLRIITRDMDSSTRLRPDNM